MSSESHKWQLNKSGTLSFYLGFYPIHLTVWLEDTVQKINSRYFILIMDERRSHALVVWHLKYYALTYASREIIFNMITLFLMKKKKQDYKCSINLI